jgi:tellurite resistance protein
MAFGGYFNNPYESQLYTDGGDACAKPVSMKIHVICKGAIQDQNFTISCGAGVQTIKWLSLVCAQKISSRLPHGSRRGYEHEPGGVRGVFNIPREIRRIGGADEALDPLARINEVLKDKETVNLSLATSYTQNSKAMMNINKFGVPKSVCSEFSRRAFYPTSCAPLQKLKPEVSLCRSAYEQGRVESKKINDAEHIVKKDKLGAKQAAQFQEAMMFHYRSGVQSDEEVNEREKLMLDRTFFEMKLDTLADDQQVAGVREVLAKHLGLLDDVFKFFAGAFDNGLNETISISEFRHFLTKTQVFQDLEQPSLVIANIWKVTNLESKPDPKDENPDGEFTRSEFFEAIVRVAKERYIDSHTRSTMANQAANQARNQNAKQSNGRRKSVACAQVANDRTLPEVFDRFITEYVQPYFESHAQSKLVQDMQDPKVQQLFATKLSPLMLVYNFYSLHQDLGLEMDGMDSFQAAAQKKGRKASSRGQCSSFICLLTQSPAIRCSIHGKEVVMYYDVACIGLHNSCTYKLTLRVPGQPRGGRRARAEKKRKDELKLKAQEEARKKVSKKEATPTMCFDEFCEVLFDAGLVRSFRGDADPDESSSSTNSETNSETTALTSAEVRQCFTLSQSDDEFTSAELQNMVFAEFCESLARVAVAKWESDTISFFQKVQMALESVTSLAAQVPEQYAMQFRAEQSANSIADARQMRRLSLHDTDVQ